jgi:Fe2+ or Zn2+ uptake regulation protein
MEPESFLIAFSTPIRVRVCIALGDKELTLKQIFEECKNKYSETKNRETIYRALEELLKYNIVDKRYNKKEKRICYNLRVKKALIDFVAGKVELKDEV